MRISLFHIAFSGLCAGLFPVFIHDDTLTFSNSIFGIILWAALFVLFEYVRRQKYERRMHLYTYLCGGVLAILTAFGYAIEVTGEVRFTDGRFLLAIAAYIHVFAQMLCVLWDALKKWETRLAKSKAPSTGIGKVWNYVLQRPVLMMVFLLAGWSLCYISLFPGGFIYDAAREFEQLTSGYDGDFPLLHSFLITRIFKAGYELTGSYNVGIAAFTILQMILLSGIFAYILKEFEKRGVNRGLLALGALYFALFPTIHLLATCTARDVLFSAFMLWLIFEVYCMTQDPARFALSWKRIVKLALAFVCTALSRNNGLEWIMGGLLLLACIWIAIRLGREKIRQVLLFAAVTLGSYALIMGLLTAACQPMVPASTRSSLSLFSQTLARAYVEDGEHWADEDKKMFREYVSLKDLDYVAENGDSTKGALKVNEERLPGFLKFWGKMGLRYPGVYLDAVLANTRGMWFPGAVPDGYQERGIESYAEYDKCYFFVPEKIGAPGKMTLWLPEVREWYRDIGLRISVEKIPVVSMLFSIGFHFQMLLHALIYLVYRKRWHLMAPLMLLLAYCMISAFVPLILVRYFAALFFAFPVVTVFVLQPGGVQNT